MIDEKILEDYIQDGLAMVDESLDQIGSDGCSPSGVNAIFRCLHTIKGASGFLGLESMSTFVHRFEGYLKQWQEKNRGLNKDESRKFAEGLHLVQDALARAHEHNLPEKPEYIEFIDSLEELVHVYDRKSISELEEIFDELKMASRPEYEEAYQKEISVIGAGLSQLLEDIQAARSKFILPIAPNTISKVTLNNEDITESTCRILEGLEKVGIHGKKAFLQLNVSLLESDLYRISQLLHKSGQLLSWDIIKDLCEISPEVVEEAFRRIWTDGIITQAQIDYQNIQEIESIKSSKKHDDTDSEESDQPAEQTTEKNEEYVRVAGTILQRMTESTGDLVADRNSLENLIQEMGTLIPARYRRYLQDNYTNLDKHVNDLELELSHLSNRQLNDVFRRLQPMVANLSESLGKKVNLTISGGEIEIPRDLLRALNDPLVHIVRNSMDHGIETPKEREKVKKSIIGTLSIRAERNDDRLTILIKDDGKGLNADVIRKKALDRKLIQKEDQLSHEDIVNLIFLPGFSTKDKATDVSGRGVGMDVVRTAIESKGGRIQMNTTTGQGTEIELNLPLSEGYRTQDVLLVQAGKNIFGVEYRCLKEILDESKIDIHCFKDKYFFEYRGTLLPFVNLEDLFQEGNFSHEINNKDHGRILVVEDEQQHLAACRVDKVQRKVKVVVTPFIHDFLKDNPLLRGTAVIGTGEPYLILDFSDVDMIIH